MARGASFCWTAAIVAHGSPVALASAGSAATFSRSALSSSALRAIAEASLSAAANPRYAFCEFS